MSHIICFESVGGSAIAQLADLHSLTTLDGTELPDDLDTAGVRAVVVRNRTQVDDHLLSRLPALQIIARVGVGLDNIDVGAAQRRGVVVASPRGANARSVAELTLALALAVARRLVPLDHSTRNGMWDRRPGRELYGRTWGLLGAGATGLATGQLARAMGMRVVAHDPHADESELARKGIQPMSLEQVFTEAEVLSCHLPATSGTYGMVGSRLLSSLREGAIFINTGRGEVVDEQALVAALRSGRLSGAGLDVRAIEPPALGSLERLDNVVLTPHVAGITVDSQDHILSVLAADITAVLAGGAALNAVEQVTR